MRAIVQGGVTRPLLGVAPLAAILMLLQGVALAQTAGQVLERARPETPDPERTALPGARAPEARGIVSGVAPGETFILGEVTLEGATAFDRGALSRFWDDSLGRPVGLAELGGIASDIQAFYRDAGFVFTRVLAARVPARPDAVRLIVVEARISEVTIEEPGASIGPVRQLLERLAEPLRGLENPSIDDLERVVLLINDVPGVTRATAVPRPGQDGPGALALSINVERDLFSGALFADTRQSPTFGEGLVGVVASASSYSAAADTTTLTLSNTFWDSFDDLDERTIAQLEHQRHVGGAGTVAGARLLGSRANPGGDIEPLDLGGEQRELEVWVEHPLMRTRPLSVWARGGFEALEDQLDADDGAGLVEDSLRVAYVEAEFLSRSPSGFTSGVVGLRQGLGVFGASEEGDALLSRADGDPEATIVYAEMEREHVLPMGLAFYGLVSAQWASAPLMGAEEFALGGTTFGRGYDPSELLGDHGVGVTAELRWRERFDLDTTPISAEFYSFADAGRIWNRGDTGQSNADLASVGLGVRAVAAGDLFIAVELAKPLEELRRTGSDEVRAFLTVQKLF